MKKLALLAFASSLLLSSAAFADDKKEDKKADEASDAAIAKTLLDSSLVVQYRFKFDGGDDPLAASSWGQGQSNMAERASLKRPLEMPGYLLSNGEIMTPDIMAPSRFLKSVSVTRDGVSLPASIVSRSLDRGAAFLKIDGESGAVPLTFSADASLEPAKSANFWLEGPKWRVVVKKLSPERVEFPETKNAISRGPSQSLLLSADGKPLGFLMRNVDLDGSWRGDPTGWPKDDVEALDAKFASAKKSFESSLRFARLFFKLPPKAPGDRFAFQPRQAEAGSPDNGSEAFAPALVLDAGTAVAFTNVNPEKLSCLDYAKIASFDGSDEVDCVCSAFLKDFSAVILEPKGKPFVPSVRSPASQAELKDKTGLFALVETYPEKLDVELFPAPVSSFDKTFKNLDAFRFPLNLGGSYDKVKSCKALADLEGRVVAFALEQRVKPRTDGNAFFMSQRSDVMISVNDLAGIVSDPALSLPLKPMPENQRREPWFGADLQRMTLELARANKVSQETRNGRIGGIVSDVVAGSPAEKAGVKPGDILLRVVFDGDAAPIDIELQEFSRGGFEYPWAQLDMIPGGSLQNMPPPWGSSVNSFNKFLADAGAGRLWSLELLRGGKPLRIDGLRAELGPEDFSNAAKFKLEKAGLTVKNLTYDARRYFKLSPEAPGVVVSKLESGGKASVAGMKPYELVVSVDGEKVHDVKDFERLVAGKPELRLIVDRLSEERSVRMTGLDEKSEDKEKQP